MAIVNLGRLANQRFPWLNPNGPRRRHQIILREEGQDESNPDQADEESSEESENEDNGDNQNFDTQLPTQHSVSHQIILEQCTDKTSITPFRQGTGLGQRIQTWSGNLVRSKPYFQSLVNPTHHCPLKIHNSGPKLGPDQSVRPYMMSRACQK